jgi:hypothetical protein
MSRRHARRAASVRVGVVELNVDAMEQEARGPPAPDHPTTEQPDRTGYQIKARLRA